MSCCFENTLHYSSPANGGRGVVRIGMMMPESVELFVCPFACGRHGAISAMKQELKGRLSYLYINQSDVINGYDDLIPPAVGELLDALPVRPKVVFVFVSCLDDLIGTDHDALLETLGAQYPDVRFRIGHMNPISQGSATPPPVSIQNNLYSLLEPSDGADDGVNCIGNLVEVSPQSELHKFLHSLGYGKLRHISQYQTFDGYQEMASSRLNLVIAPPGRQAAGQMREKLGIPFLFLPVSYRLTEIEAGYRDLAAFAGQSPDFDFVPHRDAALRAIERAKGRVGETPLIVDASAFIRPFEAARALLEYGFPVMRVQAQECIPIDQEHCDWLRETHPEVDIMQSQHHRAVLFDRRMPGSISVGADGAYLAGSRYAVNLFSDEGLFGYHGVQTLMELLEHALDAPVDLEQMIHEYGLVV